MTGVLSLLVTMGLVVILSIDHPFTGPVYIHPDALERGAGGIRRTAGLSSCSA